MSNTNTPKRILNLYSGIGGNRKLWSGNIKVTAVEMNPEIAAIYKDFFPDDEVIVGDAHQYLLDKYKEFDFIWSSPPCPSHSRARYWSSKGGKVDPVYPSMSLYQEIIFMQGFADCKWVVENVVPYYEPLLNPVKLGRHLFWSNFYIPPFEANDADIKNGSIDEWQELHGFDISGYKLSTRRDQVLRNCVHPETGLHIFNRAMEIQEKANTKQIQLL